MHFLIIQVNAGAIADVDFIFHTVQRLIPKYLDVRPYFGVCFLWVVNQIADYIAPSRLGEVGHFEKLGI